MVSSAAQPPIATARSAAAVAAQYRYDRRSGKSHGGNEASRAHAPSFPKCGRGGIRGHCTDRARLPHNRGCESPAKHFVTFLRRDSTNATEHLDDSLSNARHGDASRDARWRTSMFEVPLDHAKPAGEKLAGLRPVGRRRRQAGRGPSVARVPAGRTGISRTATFHPLGLAQAGAAGVPRAAARLARQRAKLGRPAADARTARRCAGPGGLPRTLSRRQHRRRLRAHSPAVGGTGHDVERARPELRRAFARSITCPRIRKDCARCSSPAGCLRSPRAPMTTIARRIRSCAARRGSTLPGIPATRPSHCASWSTCTRATSRCPPAGG